MHCLEGHVKSHVSHENPMASLKSRSDSSSSGEVVLIT